MFYKNKNKNISKKGYTVKHVLRGDIWDNEKVSL